MPSSQRARLSHATARLGSLSILARVAVGTLPRGWSEAVRHHVLAMGLTSPGAQLDSGSPSQRVASSEDEGVSPPPSGDQGGGKGSGGSSTDLSFSWVGLAILLVTFWLVAPGFYSRDTWIAVSLYGSEIVLLAAGQLFVIVTGGIDLSDGAVVGLSGMVSGVVMVGMWNGGHGASQAATVLIGVLVAVGIGVGVGLLNGTLVAYVRIPPFIVTLGTLGMAGAAINLVNNGQNAVAIPPIFGTVGAALVGDWMPVPFLIAIGITIIVGVWLRNTRFGWQVYAIGSNPLAATRSGLPVRRRLIAVYVVSGCLSSIAGLLVMSRFAEASTSAGSGDELTAIAAVVIGGASLFGGRGTMLGAVVGTAILSILTSGLVLAGLLPFWQPFAVGAVLILAVAFDITKGRWSAVSGRGLMAQVGALRGQLSRRA